MNWNLVFNITVILYLLPFRDMLSLKYITARRVLNIFLVNLAFFAAEFVLAVVITYFAGDFILAFVEMIRNF